MTSDSPARVAADVAALLPVTDPLARLARQRLDGLATQHRAGEHMIGTPLRDAAVDPRPGDFIPKRRVVGHPGLTMHAEVDSEAYQDAVDAVRQERGR